MSKHIPVLLNEVLNFLDPSDGKIYFDGTFGGGGYSRAILKKADCSVVACDRDELVIPIAEKLQKEFPSRFSFFHSKFSGIKKILAQQNIKKLDGIVLDLGLSNFQLEDESRGFSFNARKSRYDHGTVRRYGDERHLPLFRRATRQHNLLFWWRKIFTTYSENHQEKFARYQNCRRLGEYYTFLRETKGENWSGNENFSGVENFCEQGAGRAENYPARIYGIAEFERENCRCEFPFFGGSYC